MTAEPDPRTAADDNEDATNRGQSTPQPAEGGAGTPPPGNGSPQDAEVSPGVAGG